MDKGKSVMLDPVKEKLNQEKLIQGSGKVATNDLNGNQLYPKETKEYLHQIKKQEKREAKQIKKQETIRRQKTEEDAKKQESPKRQKTKEPGNSGCCGSGDPCSGCDDECVDLCIMILCFPAFMFD